MAIRVEDHKANTALHPSAPSGVLAVGPFRRLGHSVKVHQAQLART